MAWIIQNTSNSIVCIDDLGIVLQRGQTRDVDLLGRDTAEKSKYLKNAISAGLLTEVKKDAPPQTAAAIDTKIVDDMKKTTEQAVAAATAAQAAVQAQATTIQKQNDIIQQQADTLKNTASVLEKVKILAEQFPMEMKAFRESMANIKVERAQIAEEKKFITDGTSEAEMKAHEKILKKRDAALEKNYEQLGQTITKKVDADLNETLDALDELGI